MKKWSIPISTLCGIGEIMFFKILLLMTNMAWTAGDACKESYSFTNETNDKGSDRKLTNRIIISKDKVVATVTNSHGDTVGYQLNLSLGLLSSVMNGDKKQPVCNAATRCKYTRSLKAVVRNILADEPNQELKECIAKRIDEKIADFEKTDHFSEFPQNKNTEILNKKIEK